MTLTAEELANRALDAKECAQYLNVSEKTVLKLLRSGALPSAKVGRQWRVSRQALEAFLSGQVAVHGDEAEVKKPRRKKKSV